MSHISKPVDWEVFSIPPIQPVQYYSILKKQREFSQLIKQYDAQVFRHGYLHYCGIVPKYLSSSLNNRYEIFIVFLDETSTTSFIGFRVKVSKETFTYESKSLLLFLKNSEKTVLYSMNNNRIHVHCGRNKWELFYLLYDDYLRKYVLTIIGTQFFYHFVYSYCIEKEKQFLKSLYKGSRLICVSKSSIYYKIHRKRKISVTDLIHMTLNMPKPKKCILSCFDSKESILHSDVGLREFYTVSGNKINVSKLMLKKYIKEGIKRKKQGQILKFSDDTNKRKFGSINISQNLENNTSKYIKLSDSYSTKNQWKQYKETKPYTVKSYSAISFINPLVPSLLKNKNSSCSSNSHLMKTYSDMHLPLMLSSDSKKVEIKNSTVVHEACTWRNHMTKDIEKPKNLFDKVPFHESESLDFVTYSEYAIPKDSSSHHSTFPNSNYENRLCQNKSDLTCDIHCSHFSTDIKCIDKADFAAEDVSFTTAAGKKINVSSAAMLKAYKLCEKEEISPEKNISNALKHKVSEKIDPDSKRKSVTKASLPKISENKNLQIFSFFKNDENMPKKLAAAQSSDTENLKVDNFDAFEDVTFSTATGKAINISSTALEAAQKLIYKSTDEEKMPLHSENISVQRNQSLKTEISNNGCTSKAEDVDMDNTLVEKFFEDVQFDDKELELTEINIKKDNLNTNFEPKNDKNLPSRKPRKSLGGRRSMRYCSDKL